MGPSTLPCGTPHETSDTADSPPAKLTTCERFEMKDSIQSKTLPRTPKAVAKPVAGIQHVYHDAAWCSRATWSHHVRSRVFSRPSNSAIRHATLCKCRGRIEARPNRRYTKTPLNSLSITRCVYCNKPAHNEHFFNNCSNN